MSLPRVLMVNGAYYPELSGGGLQCRQLVRALQGHAQILVLTTAADASLPPVERVDGVPVYRVAVNVRKPWSVARAAILLARRFLELAGECDVVHFHGFSRKSLLLIMLAKLFRKRLVMKLGLVGEDDPLSIRKRGRLDLWCYQQLDSVIGVSPRFQQLYEASRLPREKFRLIPNGVDTKRFCPADFQERRALRVRLGLPQEIPLVLFVGIFAVRKRPDVLLEAWKRLDAAGSPQAGLVFVGGTDSRRYEIDASLARRVRDEAQRLPEPLRRRVMFVEAIHDIEHYYRAADVFVLPSTGEGLPNALLEAMACGMPCIASQLPGITEPLIADGVNGILVPPEDVSALHEALRGVLSDPTLARQMGQQARATVVERYETRQILPQYLEIYQRLLRGTENGCEIPRVEALAMRETGGQQGRP